MGTQAINNLINDVYYGQTESGKEFSKDGEFLKAFENAQNLSDIESLAKRDVNPVDELSSKEEFEKERCTVRKETTDSDTRTIKTDNNDKTVSDSNTETSKSSVDKNISKDDEISEEDIEFVEENFGALVNAYSEILNISEEAVSDYFEANDIKLDTLLSADSVQDVVMGLEGISDASEILTNQELYENIDALKNFTEDLLNQISNEIDTDAEDALSKVSDIVEGFDDSLVLSETVALKETEKGYDLSDKTDKTDLTEYKEVSLNDDKADNVDVNLKASEKSDSRKDNDSEMNNQGFNGHLSSNGINQAQDGIIVDNPKEILTQTPDAQEIYNQIGEFVRNLSTEDLKEVTLQLQPETLGTIQVRVSQREGVLTAELLTQNENVRAALEGQLIDLQKDFEKSGIKVENIEVRVSTQSFDEQSQEESRNEENEASRRELPPRRINLNGLFENYDSEELQDDEKIAVEMMTANGNSLDYQA